MKRALKEFSIEKAVIPSVHDFVRGTLEKEGIAAELTEDIVLACDEAASNIVEHAYPGTTQQKKNRQRFIISLKCRKDRVIATFFDSGLAFHPDGAPLPDVNKNLSGEKCGGYGIFLIKKLVDKIVYSARHKLNVTRLIKEVESKC